MSPITARALNRPAAAGVLGCLLLLASLALARLADARESGATLTPDRNAYLVNKDIGTDRWTISFNVLAGDPTRSVNVTGNVFRADAGPPAFVVCQPTAESTGRLGDPSSVFTFTCRGSDACPTTARDCAASTWGLIDDAVALESAFFLPPGGLGSFAVANLERPVEDGDGCATLTCAASQVLARLAATGGEPLGSVARLAAPPAVQAQSVESGATLSYDQFTYLVSKDIGNERWSIALNLAPVDTGQGVVSRVQNVTGNVFKRDGSPPSFVFCTERLDSPGNARGPRQCLPLLLRRRRCLRDHRGRLRQGAWRPISDDVPIHASFFLPPGGLPPAPQSDSEIVIIGRTSDPPAIVTRDLTLAEGSAADRGAVAGTCPVGSTCLADSIGSCAAVAGDVVELTGFGCGCRVADVDPGCITCGGGASGTCGGACEFVVGSATARGECLPVSSDSGDCACFAIGAGQDQTVASCSGPLDAACTAGRCCADDPRDGCDLASGDVTCSGVCVPSSCAPGDECGICLAGQQSGTCGNGAREGAEQCDGGDLPSSCVELGFEGGTLRCDAGCRFDTRACIAPVPTATPQPTPSLIPPNPSPTPIATPVPTATSGPTATPSPTPAVTSTPSPEPTSSPDPTPSASPPPGASCPFDEVNLSSTSGLDVVVNVGAASGNLTLTYEPFGLPAGGGNEFIVERLDGTELFSSGRVFDPDSNSYPPLQDSFGFSGGAAVRVRVVALCNGGGGSDSWTVNLGCAE